MSEQVKEQQSDWVFPDVENFRNPDEEYKKKLNQNMRQQDDLKRELEVLKKTYEEKLQIVNQAYQLAADPLTEINDEIIALFHDILKRTAKKIILKEIELDPSRMKAMVDQIRSLIKSQKGIVTVYLSKKDAENFSKEPDKTEFAIQVDETLSTGDVMVKNQISEVRAVLLDRVDEIIKANYD